MHIAHRLVSIHAPTWGATSAVGCERQDQLGFNPRARMGRDASILATASASSGFNPRARVGRDDPGRLRPLRGSVRFNPRARVGRDRTAARLGWSATVSIHAPAWGATRREPLVFPHTEGFNPRARVGRDGMCFFMTSRERCFNPRARVGRDRPQHDAVQPHGRVSIHAPAWGATSRLVWSAAR